MTRIAMPKKLLSSLAIVAMLLVVTASQALAATLQLLKIGTSSTEGKTFTDWTYTKPNPDFTGTADPNQEVTIKIDDATNKVTSDVNGNWTFTPVSLGTGDYAVTISSGSQYITFNLHISESSSSVASTTSTTTSTTSGTATASTTKGGVTLPEELPKTGSGLQTLGLVGGGLALIIGAFISRTTLAQLVLAKDEEYTSEDEIDE